MKEAVTEITGVPVIWPAEVRIRPDGRAPRLTVHVYGATPPWAPKVALYGVPETAFVRAVVVIINTLELTVIDRAALAVSGVVDESVTVTTKLKVPLAVGVPEITPVDAARESPAGSAPEETDQV